MIVGVTDDVVALRRFNSPLPRHGGGDGTMGNRSNVKVNKVKPDPSARFCFIHERRRALYLGAWAIAGHFQGSKKSLS